MALALNNLKRVDMPLNKETKLKKIFVFGEEISKQAGMKSSLNHVLCSIGKILHSNTFYIMGICSDIYFLIDNS